MVTWKPDASVSACELCHRPFSFFLRRHHCRRCGGIFCASCSAHRLPLLDDDDDRRDGGEHDERQGIVDERTRIGDKRDGGGGRTPPSNEPHNAVGDGEPPRPRERPQAVGTATHRVCRTCHHRWASSIPPSIPSLSHASTDATDDAGGAWGESRRRGVSYERRVKVSVLGAPHVGKTSMIVQLVEKRFDDDYRPSVMRVYPYTMTCPRGGFVERARRSDDGRDKGSREERPHAVHVEIQDAGGVSACDLFQPHYTIGVHAFVVAYAVDDASSLAAARSIHDRLLECGCVNTPTMLVGNKSDVVAHRRAVSASEGRQTAEGWGALWMEVSAKSYGAVERVFARLIAELIRREQ